MVQLQSKGKEKKWQSDYAEHLIFKIDNTHAKKSLTMKKQNLTQQHSPLHLEDYLWIQKIFAVTCTYLNYFALVYTDPELTRLENQSACRKSHWCHWLLVDR